MKRSKQAKAELKRVEKLRAKSPKDKGDSDFQRDPWLNPHLFPKNARPFAAVSSVINAVEKDEHRRRARKPQDRVTLHKYLIPLLCNLMHHYLTGSPGQGFPVPRSKKDLGKEGTRYEPFVFPRSFPKTLDALCALSIAEQTIGAFSGFPGKSKRTTVKAGARLIALIEEHQITSADFNVGDCEEVIILKRPKHGRWDEGARIDYRDTEVTRGLRNEVQALNAWLAHADIRFDAAAHDRKVDVLDRRLHRNFTLGRFDRGGRLFGGFWVNLNKDVRFRGISIDGEAVIGLDYSQLNPMLACHVAKAAPTLGDDAYTLPNLEECREGVKRVFNAMLFSHPLKLPKGVRKLFPREVKCSDVTNAILQRHPHLKGVLSSVGIGHQLQFLESQIMMGVLRKCQQRKIVALPVFDCVVVKASAEKSVREIMQREFKTTTGLTIAVKQDTAR